MVTHDARAEPDEDASLVSVVMPAFNAGRYLREAIDSVLGQSHRPITLIVVDDGSTDDTAAIMASYGADIIAMGGYGNGGIGAARNRGLAAAKGAFIAFMDADDIWTPAKLERQVAQLEAEPEIDLVFGYMQLFISPELPDAVKALRHCPAEPLAGPVAATMLVRRAAFERVGLFDPSLRVGEFIDWFSRARVVGLRSRMLDDVFLLRRVHDTNTGVLQRTSYVDYVRVAREALKRNQAARLKGD